MDYAVRKYSWKDGKSLTFGERTLIMGILNVTPDSFSDGGLWNQPEKALRHALEMVEEGADIIDVGAESSRPGFVPMPAEEEMERLRPYLELLVKELPVPVSVDTFKSETAELAAQMGAHVLNDIWGLQYAGENRGAMARVAAKHQLPVIVMHNQSSKEYSCDIIESMQSFFAESIKIAEEAGVAKDQLILDPGIGFGKTPEANLTVIKRLEELVRVDEKLYPMLLASSRKSFIGAALDLPVEERMEATGASCVYGILHGAGMVRVHDVKPITRMCRMTDAILKA